MTTPNDSAAIKSLRDDVAAYRANGTVVTEETLRQWEKRLTALAFPEPADAARIEERFASLHQRLQGLQEAVSDVLRRGRIDDRTWEKLQAALVESNRD